MLYGIWYDELLNATKVYNGMTSFRLGEDFPEKDTFRLSSKGCVS